MYFYDGKSENMNVKMSSTTTFYYLLLHLLLMKTSKGKDKSLGIPMHPVSEIEIAELSKIAENAHRYLQIAFAEDLYLYCQANNINFPELRDAINTKWNVHILRAKRRNWRTLSAKGY